MNKKKPNPLGSLRSAGRLGLAALSMSLLLTATFGVQAAAVNLKVVSARSEPAVPVTKGAAITNYKYLLNIDNTGSTIQRSPAPGIGCNPADPGYPNSCLWTSIAGAKGSSPVYSQGDQSTITEDLNNVPDGKYLISVLADGYKLDGRHFTVSGTTVTWQGSGANGTVELQPWPMPDAQIQAAVFEDISPVNSAPDLPAEHGMAGFQGHILDYLGEVTTDVYGQPLCGTGKCLSACYVVSNGVDVGTVAPVDAAGRCPSPEDAVGLLMTDNNGGSTTAPAGSVIEGKVKIPNLGPNRYTLSVTPPDGSGWVQTTTLEGNHDWDAWVMEGATGLDTEFLIAGEPFPAIIFGYVPAPGTPSALTSPVSVPLSGSGSITGVIEAVKIYVPTTGGIAGLPGEIWGGLQGAKFDKPIENPWVTLTDLNNGDTIVWAGQGNANGRFTIPNVPDGTYSLTWWDEPQNQILDLVNVTVSNGETVDMGVLPLSGWWTFFDGYVYNDTNRNGIKDPGEPGLSNYTLTMRKRENSLMDRGTTLTTTDANGYYKFEAAYPMTQWLVMEAYDDSHYSTGVTYQADNQPMPTTILGAGVDVSVHPIIGLSGHMDWGKHTYDATGRNGIDPRNGGIVGTVSYDTTRNELDPRYAAVEDWQPSIPDLTVKLFAPVDCGTTSAPCDATGNYELASDGSGSYAKGNLLNTYVTETWKRPNGCVARGVDGAPFVHGTDENVLPDPAINPNAECLEAPLMGIQFWGGDTANAEFPGVEVNGNYGFGDGCFGAGGFDETTGACADGLAPTALPSGDYLVQVDLNSQLDVKGRPIYKVTREEDVNIGNGDQFVPAVPPAACAGALHTVTNYNPTFPGGQSPFEGQAKPLCDMKLVTVNNGKSVAPSFNLYTDVPIPGRHWFIVIDDLNFSSNSKSITYGEKAGMPFVPVGIYDWTDRLVTTVESDYNGLADVLLPSTNRINCPTPSGVCGNLFRYVGNDPGVPGRLNTNFNPQFRTIAAEFEILPGLIVPADLAPTQVGVSVQLPGGQTTSPVSCALDATTPEIYAVSRPYVSGNTGAATRQFTITGKGFGTSGQVTLDGTPVTAAFGAVNATTGISTIAVTVPTSITVGPKQLKVITANGQSTVNGLTIHVLGTGYNPSIYEVGPGKTYPPAETLPATANHAIQNALDAAASFVSTSTANATRGALVVVYPNNPSANPRQNPRGAYYENLIIGSKVKLQGIGPGSADGSVRGSIIDGSAFAGDSPVATDWYAKIEAAPFATTDANGNTVPTWGGNPTINDGAVISVYVPRNGRSAFPTGNFSATTAPSIDGFDIRGGDQQGFPGNINAIGGTPTGLPGGLTTQGGAIFANAYANNLQITNNVIESNGGAYGAVRIGTPDLPSPDTDNQNRNVRIVNNRIIKNAGTNQAGGIGLFNGANGYEIAGNDICGNFSAEYGGGISHVGSSPSGKIHDNRLTFNQSYDEGGAIMIAGALPANPANLSPGSGAVDIYNNLIQANMSNDDGGGIRFLMAGNFPMNVYNNIIANNVSTHEGGGISLNDTPNVRVYNNTIMKNLTTATAVTSNGSPAPAGLSTSVNSALLQVTLPNGSPLYSNPLLFNNIFWDNRAGTRNGGTVTGLSGAIDYWDMGVADNLAANLAPTNSVLMNNRNVTAAASNSVGTDPLVVSTFNVDVTFNAWRNNPAFLGAIMISADLPPNQMGDYHLTSTSAAAINRGATSKSGTTAPTFDIDNQSRTGAGNPARDIGADEFIVVTPPAGTVNFTSATLGTLVNVPLVGPTLSFGNQAGLKSSTIKVSVTQGSVTFGAPSVSNTFGSSFTLGANTCTGTRIANTTCSITVNFNGPSGISARAGQLTINSNATNSPTRLALIGT